MSNATSSMKPSLVISLRSDIEPTSQQGGPPVCNLSLKFFYLTDEVWTGPCAHRLNNVKADNIGFEQTAHRSFQKEISTQKDERLSQPFLDSTGDLQATN
ncbi:hypothetical protein NDU88_001170 [Pleurodeles waltl]|uniref:Uncharacterized protein n=1 Tax=Pleurodeles waltl TaxID=8319 RepID=A0AAV7WLD6_PLEWA|nr:hypothetical protein NDU88_001170 [Pleurodeles waltl]